MTPTPSPTPFSFPVEITDDPFSWLEAITAIATVLAALAAVLTAVWAVRETRRQSVPVVVLRTALAGNGRLHVYIACDGPRPVTIEGISFWGQWYVRADGRPERPSIAGVPQHPTYNGDSFPAELTEGKQASFMFEGNWKTAEVLSARDSVGRTYAAYVNPFANGVPVDVKPTVRRRFRLWARKQRKSLGARLSSKPRLGTDRGSGESDDGKRGAQG